jgi:hypothetical protein
MKTLQRNLINEIPVKVSQEDSLGKELGNEIGYVCELDKTDTGEHGECLQWVQTTNKGTLFCKDESEFAGAVWDKSGYVKLKGV